MIAAGVVIGGLPDLGKAAAVQLGQNSVVWSGNYRLSVIPANENRTPLRWKDLGSHLRNATVAIEDKRYWQHGALDYEGIGRALWRDVTHGNYAEGGSTITQQLVRNLYIPDSARSKTIQRKLDEAWLAIQAEDRWTKAQILTMYLNTVFYGRNAYGAEAAAQTYFNRHANAADAAAGGAARRAAAGAERLRPVQEPRAREATAQRRAARHAAAAHDLGRRRSTGPCGRRSGCTRASSTRRCASRTS